VPSIRQPVSGKVALITGSGRGLGLEIAAGLAASGMRVAVNGRTAGEVDRAARAIGALGVVADVSDPVAVEALVKSVEDELGPIELLVNNAGVILPEETAWDVAADSWWKVFEVNVFGPYLCARAVIPGMIARGSGRIVNVGGAAAWVASRRDSAYSASKAAVYRLSETLAIQLAPHGVSVFTISPGLVRTSMTANQYPPNAPWADPQLSVALVLTLASGRADELSGRCFHAQRDDIEHLIAHAEDVVRTDSNAIRLRENVRGQNRNE
jgi:3-oxoacyl-[acyl-carrier protein] reductase